MLLREPSTTHSDRYALGLVAFNAITLRDGKTEGERFEDPLGLPVHDADANLVYGWLGDAIRGSVPSPVASPEFDVLGRPLIASSRLPLSPVVPRSCWVEDPPSRTSLDEFYDAVYASTGRETASKMTWYLSAARWERAAALLEYAIHSDICG